MSNDLHLLPRHRAKLDALLQEHLPDVEVWAYGSRVTGESHDGSDLDLVLRGPHCEEIDIGRLGDFNEAVESSTIPFIVEARDWARLPESFHDSILPEYVVLREGFAPRRSDKLNEMMLGDVCTKIGSGATPRGGKEAYVRNGTYALIRSQNIHNTGFSHDGLAFISQEQAEALQNVEVLRNDVLLNITGDSVARVCQADPQFLPARVNQHVAIVRPDPSKLDPEYLRYYLASPEGQSTLLNWASSGGTRNALTKRMIESLVVQAPADLSEQRAIARVLGSLDDKIALNRRMTETLEEMARALFQSWFVDFDPIRAKAEGRPSGLPPDLDALFPDSFEPSELGDVPAGWQPRPLGDVMARRQERISPDQMRPGTPYIGLEHMPKRSITLSAWGTTDRLASTKFGFERGDILFGRLRPYFHKVGVAPLSGVCSTDVLVLTPSSHEWFGFVLGHVSSDRFVGYADATSTGTRMPRTTWRDMARYTVPLPDRFMAAAFDDWTRPWVDRVVAATHVSHELAALRDTLLTNLLSDKFPLTYEAEAR